MLKAQNRSSSSVPSLTAREICALVKDRSRRRDESGIGRRRSSAENVPLHAAVEVGHAATRWRRFLGASRDLVGRETSVGAVGPIAVVELDEIGAPAVDLAQRREDPRVAKDRLLEGPEQALDAAVGPRVRGAGTGVADFVLDEKRLDTRRPLRTSPDFGDTL